MDAAILDAAVVARSLAEFARRTRTGPAWRYSLRSWRPEATTVVRSGLPAVSAMRFAGGKILSKLKVGSPRQRLRLDNGAPHHYIALQQLLKRSNWEQKVTYFQLLKELQDEL